MFSLSELLRRCRVLAASLRRFLLARFLPSAGSHDIFDAHGGLQQEQRQDRAVDRENLPWKKNTCYNYIEKSQGKK